MKLLFIAPQPFFRERGTPIRTRHQLHVLSQMGHQVDLVCYPFGTDVNIPGVRVFRTMRLPGIRDVPVGPSLGKIPMDFLLFWRALLLCLRNRYDVIQAVEESAFFAAWFKKLFRCRLIYNMDSHVSDQLRYTGFMTLPPVLRLVQALEKSAMRNAAYVVSVCQALSDVVEAYAPGTRVLQLEDAPLHEEFRDDPEGAKRIRAQYQLGDGPVAVYLGNFISYQGVDLLLEAVPLVHQRKPEARFLIVGGEPHQVAEKRAHIESQKLDSVCIFTGKRPTSEMTAFTTLASVLVSPRTQGTNTPMKIYDYMQSRRPIVATNLPTHTQALDDSCAMLTDLTPESLAASIVKVLDDPRLAAELARRAAERLAQRYSLSIFREKARAAYAELAASL